MLWYVCFQLHVDVFILVCGRVSNTYLLFLHFQLCVIVGCFRLLGLCFLDMAALHFCLISLVECAFVGHILLKDLLW